MLLRKLGDRDASRVFTSLALTMARLPGQGVQPASMRHPPRDVVTIYNSAKVRGFQDTPDHGAWKKSLGSISGHLGECYGELAARLLHFP